MLQISCNGGNYIANCEEDCELKSEESQRHIFNLMGETSYKLYMTLGNSSTPYVISSYFTVVRQKVFY